MLIAGIDEAGRGPCIGPLVMAVTSIKKENEHELTEIGVTDSKLIPKEKLTPNGVKREKALGGMVNLSVIGKLP